MPAREDKEIGQRDDARGIPLVAIAGSLAADADAVYPLGVSAMFGIDRGAEGFARSAPKSRENYRRTLADVLRLIRALS